jgi:hypothetical protein
VDSATTPLVAQEHSQLQQTQPTLSILLLQVVVVVDQGMAVAEVQVGF